MYPIYCRFSTGRTFDDLHIPDDIVEHYKLLLQKTEKMRKLPVHHGAGYNGPWIENHYINHFMRQPLSYFNGLVPLFVQFVDIHVNDFRTKVRPNPTLKSTAEELTALLRDDILYVAIRLGLFTLNKIDVSGHIIVFASQDDQGITANLFEKKPNILVLSAGGYGHIPIPLIKGELGYVPPRRNRKYDLDVGFCGKIIRCTVHNLPSLIRCVVRFQWHSPQSHSGKYSFFICFQRRILVTIRRLFWRWKRP